MSHPPDSLDHRDLSLEEATYRKVTRRLIPLLFICFVVSYLDRVNVSFAKLQMLDSLHWTDAVYGLGAGVFFVGYFLFEVPSNILLFRFGARVWLPVIMMAWGLVSSGLLFVRTPVEFYALRFVLGLAEAGFFPGVIFYLSSWFPRARRGRATALFMAAIALSGIVGGPISGWIMEHCASVAGLAGWQWLFLLEGIPSVVMGVITFCVLDDSIQAAPWLDAREKMLLQQKMAEEAGARETSPHEAFGDGRVWLLGLLYFLLLMGLYGVLFWLPQIIKNAGVSHPFEIGLLSVIPNGVAGVVMVLVARHSDRVGHRRRYIAYCALLGAAGLVIEGFAGTNVFIAMAMLTLALTGILTALPLFWTFPSTFLTGLAAATGIAIINSLGSVAGFISPFLLGVFSSSHHMATGLNIVALSLFLASGLVMLDWKNGRITSCSSAANGY